MLDFFNGVSGVRLTDPEYDEDFAARWEQVRDHDCWKLERRQYFAESWDESWVAFARGDWEEALRLTEAKRETLKAEYEQQARRGSKMFRVRIVELPLTPYMQWELCGFRVRAEAGERIRVVGPETVAPFEDDDLVPELLSVGADILYEIRYGDDGSSDGAIRYSGAALTTEYQAFVQRLWDQGEDFATFFAREVAPLPPPRTTLA